MSINSISSLSTRQTVWVKNSTSPSLGGLRHTPQEVLDHIRETRYPELGRVDLSWTDETRASYSAFVGYPVPDCYYEDGPDRRQVYVPSAP